MPSLLESVQQQAMLLSPQDKAALALLLIRDLDAGADEDTETLWVEEAQCRYAAYQAGEVASIPGDEVLARVRARIK
ncbi:hypothetical protein BURK2_00965 [Burkholderiales bacterium]|nr:MAG: addiction module protein [Burkholderiales bacterium]CAG0965286.1 hypothetical protein BURK2_00965 [Burkholderiales bacterium]